MNKVTLDEMKSKVDEAEELLAEIEGGQLAIKAICTPGANTTLDIVVWVDGQAFNLSGLLDGSEFKISVVKRLRAAVAELQAKYEAL